MKTIVAFCFLLISISISAQEALNYKTIDQKTYDQYLNAQWKELIITGKNSLKNNIDFYYLQVRIGIAYYELKKYRKAIPYFERARKLNNENEVVDEYLYYSYLFSGRIFDARKTGGRLSENLKSKIGIKTNPIISALNIDSRMENVEDFEITPDLNELLQQDVRTDYSYFSFGVEHLIKDNRKIFWSYSHIRINSDIFNISELNEQIKEERTVNQNQFYYSYHNQLKYGLNLVLAANLVNVVSSGSSLSPSGSFGSGAGPGFGGGTSGMISTTNHFVSNEIVGFFALRADLANFKLGLNSSVSNLDKGFQVQPGIDFIWYPLSNTNIYLLTNASYKYENSNNQWLREPVFKQSIGFRLYTVYFEPSYTYGNIINHTENNAFIINNDNDVIKDRYEFLIHGYFFKNKLNLFFKYQNYNKTNTYYLNGVSNEITYQNQTLTGGIKWNF